MSAALEYPHPHRVSTQEYLRMGAAGVFAPEARLELIAGEIVEMAPIGSRHAGVVNRLNRLLGRLLGERAVVSIQNPIIAGEHSVPQPDIALLKPRSDDYSAAHPSAADVLLVIEVAETTLAFDVGTKVALYARAGIAEAWVVDVAGGSVRIYRQPGPSGYQASTIAAGEEVASCLAFPDLKLPVAGIFPKAGG